MKQLLRNLTSICCDLVRFPLYVKKLVVDTQECRLALSSLRNEVSSEIGLIVKQLVIATDIISAMQSSQQAAAIEMDVALVQIGETHNLVRTSVAHLSKLKELEATVGNTSYEIGAIKDICKLLSETIMQNEVEQKSAINNIGGSIELIKQRLSGDCAESPSIFESLNAIHRNQQSLRDIASAFADRQNLSLDRAAHSIAQLDGVQHWLSVALEEIKRSRASELALGDQLSDIVLALVSPTLVQLGWTLIAERPLAADSVDHLYPKGTINDNTRHPRFVKACSTFFDSPIRHLDLGCAGGGLVWDFTLAGHHSVGIEGSDRSSRDCRAEWRTIPDRLFVGDIRYPFGFIDVNNDKVEFDIITAWEVFEHIPEEGVAGLLTNVCDNLRSGGMLVVSVATSEDVDETSGQAWHSTVRPSDWWLEQLAKFNLYLVDHSFETADFVRGSGNPRALDWDVRQTPDMGFHLVLRKA